MQIGTWQLWVLGHELDICTDKCSLFDEFNSSWHEDHFGIITLLSLQFPLLFTFRTHMVQIEARYLQVWSLVKVATLRFYVNVTIEMVSCEEKSPFSKYSCLNTHNEIWERYIDLLQNLVYHIWTYNRWYVLNSSVSGPSLGWDGWITKRVIVFCHNAGSQYHTRELPQCENCKWLLRIWTNQASIEYSHVIFVLKTSINSTALIFAWTYVIEVAHTIVRSRRSWMYQKAFH